MASLIPQTVLSMVGLGSETLEPISALASRFIKTIQKRGIFHAKHGLSWGRAIILKSLSTLDYDRTHYTFYAQ